MKGSDGGSAQIPSPSPLTLPYGAGGQGGVWEESFATLNSPQGTAPHSMMHQVLTGAKRGEAICHITVKTWRKGVLPENWGVNLDRIKPRKR